MYQTFFTDTIESKFIKYLLHNTPLPIYNSVKDGEYVIKDVIYIYITSVIKCTQSGIIGKDARYVELQGYTFGQDINQVTQRFNAEYNYYDPDTHRCLGEYLRVYRDIYGIDLLPYYNCFNYKVLEDLYLSTKSGLAPCGYINSSNSEYKILCVPIKFNKTYTIYIDCETKVLMKSVLYGNFGLLKDNAGTERVFVTDNLQESNGGVITSHNHLSFLQPKTYCLPLIDDGSNTDLVKRLYSFEKNLYLLIQLPKTNTSSVTILEGDYTQVSGIVNLEYASRMTTDSIHIKSALTQFNTQQVYAFSDRLIEFLLKNVITPDDEIEKNIVRLHNYAHFLRTDPKNKSIFTDEDRIRLYYAYKLTGNNMTDISGYVDKDMEAFITKGLEV